MTSKPATPDRFADDALGEYDAVVAKVDAAVAAAVVVAGDQLACRAGCDACCVEGLQVLPVEAAALSRHLITHDGGAGVELAPKGQGHCAFLGDDGRCAVYAARPLLCRTHGLPLRATGDAPRGALRVIDDVTVCGLNFTGRAPGARETLDATAILKLLVVVDRRFRERVGLPDDARRVALADLIAGAAEENDDDGR